MRFRVERNQLDDKTTGEVICLDDGQHFCLSLSNSSVIPSAPRMFKTRRAFSLGAYEMILRSVSVASASGIFPRVLNVQGRTGILWHSVSEVCQLKGCTGIGMIVDSAGVYHGGLTKLPDQPYAAFTELVSRMQAAHDRRERVWAEYVWKNPVDTSASEGPGGQPQVPAPNEAGQV